MLRVLGLQRKFDLRQNFCTVQYVNGYCDTVYVEQSSIHKLQILYIMYKVESDFRSMRISYNFIPQRKLLGPRSVARSCARVFSGCAVGRRWEERQRQSQICTVAAL